MLSILLIVARKRGMSCPYVTGKLVYRCPKVHFRIVLQPRPCSYFAFDFPPNFRLVFL